MSTELVVRVLPDKGADIYSVVDCASGIDVLFKAPWGLRVPGMGLTGSSSKERWLESYSGGWQVLLPNGGDECEQLGARWGYHGEAAIVPWDVVSASKDSARLRARLFTAPLVVERQVSVHGRRLRLVEAVTNESSGDVEVMWSQHPAFGAPFLEAGCLLSVPCKSFVADDRTPGTLFPAGSQHSWPVALAADGRTIDLSRVPAPGEGRSVLGYLTGFTSGFFAITNPRLRLGVGVRWPLEVFDRAWLWEEAGATTDWPWFGRAYVVAVEPATTIPAQGLTEAKIRGEHGFTLPAGSVHRAVIDAIIFEGEGWVTGVGEDGAVQLR